MKGPIKLRFVILNAVSVILLLLLLAYLGFVRRLVFNRQMLEAYYQDFSIFHMVQSYRVGPFGTGLSALYGVWALALWAAKMRRAKRFFLGTAMVVFLAANIGFPMATRILIGKKGEGQHQAAVVTDRQNKTKVAEAWKKLKQGEEVPLDDMWLALSSPFKDTDSANLSALWVDYAKRLIADPTVESSQKQGLLRSAIASLADERGSLHALNAVNEIERLYDTSTLPRSRDFYSNLIYTKGLMINPSYRIVDDSEEHRRAVADAYQDYRRQQSEVWAPGKLQKIGDALTQAGRHEEAEKQYYTAMNSKYVFTDNDKFELRERILRSQMLQGRYKEALGMWELLNAHVKNHVSLDKRKAQLDALIQYQRTGDKSAVLDFVEAYKKGERIQRLSTLGLANIVYMYEIVGENDRAIDYLDTYIADERSRNKSKYIDDSVYDEIRTASEASACVSAAERGQDRARRRPCEFLADILTIREALVRSKEPGRKGAATQALLRKSDVHLLAL